MKVASFWPTPHDADLTLEEVTTDADAERYDEHGHPVLTLSADLALQVGFAWNADDLASSGGFRELHEVQIDERLPPRSWHAGPRREATAKESFAALKRGYPSLAGAYERAAVKNGIQPWDVTEEQLWAECPRLRGEAVPSLTSLPPK